MADKTKRGESIVDRWKNEIPEQFTSGEASEEDKKEVERLQKELANKQFRDWVNRKA